tara:strand:+ start:5863 stop:5985 length:123 start_codon:yes stop_codon:yes gene_type:complete
LFASNQKYVKKEKAPFRIFEFFNLIQKLKFKLNFELQNDW